MEMINCVIVYVSLLMEPKHEASKYNNNKKKDADFIVPTCPLCLRSTLCSLVRLKLLFKGMSLFLLFHHC